MSTSKYEYIKELYKPILFSNGNTSCCKLNINDSFSGFVEKVYSTIAHSEERYFACDTLGIAPSTMDEFMQEIIISNLYEHIVLISQILNQEGLKREYVIGLLRPDLINDKSTVDRLKKRLQSNRLSAIIQVSTEMADSEDENAYIPKLMKAYRDILLIPRENTKIMDISPNYVDIFSSLILDYPSEKSGNPEDQAKISELNRIKSYQPWKFSVSTISEVENIYKQICESNHTKCCDKIAEFLFMERLFEFMNLSCLLEKDLCPISYTHIVDNTWLMPVLGYSRLHKKIIDEITVENAEQYNQTIRKFIYPVCAECIVTCVNEIICNIKKHETILKETIIQWKKSCLSYMRYSPISESAVMDSLSKILNQKKFKTELCVDLFKRLQLIRKDCEDDIYRHFDLKRHDYTCFYENNAKKENSHVFDCSFVELAGFGYYAKHKKTEDKTDEVYDITNFTKDDLPEYNRDMYTDDSLAFAIEALGLNEKGRINF